MPTKDRGSQRKGEKINSGGSAKAVEVMGKIGFEDTKSSMEQRLTKLRSDNPNSSDLGGLAVAGDPGGEAIMGDTVGNQFGIFPFETKIDNFLVSTGIIVLMVEGMRIGNGTTTLTTTTTMMMMTKRIVVSIGIIVLMMEEMGVGNGMTTTMAKMTITTTRTKMTMMTTTTVTIMIAGRKIIDQWMRRIDCWYP
jgi:hypothetical protein